jgi:hypothetical protein
MKMVSELGAWFPPRPCDGGMPPSLVGGEEGLAEAEASSAWIIDSTLSMQI